MILAQNLAEIEERIAGACRRAGRKREEITLVGVSKFQPIDAVEAAWQAGVRHFGESRVQEAAAKFDGFKGSHAGAQLHLIGALQRNKAKTATALFDCIQSVDRESLVPELAKYVAGRDEALPLLLEFRTGEESKSGFTDMEGLYRTVDVILACPSVCVCGLMTIAPNTGDAKMVRGAFRKLVSVRQELERRFPRCDWSCLSMGMSGDFEIAIEEGSTLLRIGSAIFGERS